MDIKALKSQIAEATGIKLPTLMLNRQFNEQKEPQPWLSHWDNDKRVRIVLHEDVANAMRADTNIDRLAFKKPEVVPAHENVQEYTRVMVIIPTSVEMTF